jgi:hypothetical protein
MWKSAEDLSDKIDIASLEVAFCTNQDVAKTAGNSFQVKIFPKRNS